MLQGAASLIAAMATPQRSSRGKGCTQGVLEILAYTEDIKTTIVTFEKKRKKVRKEIESALHSRQIPQIHISKMSEHASLDTRERTIPHLAETLSIRSSGSFSSLRVALPPPARMLFYGSPQGSGRQEKLGYSLTQQRMSLPRRHASLVGGPIRSRRKQGALSSWADPPCTADPRRLWSDSGLGFGRQSWLRVLRSIGIVKPLATVIKNPLGFEFARSRQDLAVVREILARLRIEIPVASIVGAERNLRRVLLVGEKGLAGRLQTLFDLRVETTILLADVLPVLVFVQQTIIENVAALNRKAAFPSGLVLSAVGVHEGAFTVELSFVELADVLDTVREFQLPIALVPCILGRPVAPFHSAVLRARPLRHRALR